AGGKNRLFITREQGRFLRRCPGTPGMECCNLFVLNPVVGCPFDCAYCFLQAYQSDPFITLYANLDDLEAEVKALQECNPGKTLRICTGELADALALEPLVRVAPYLIRLFSRMKDVLLELKTKADTMGSLLSLNHGGRTVLSFTLNAPAVAALEEQGAPTPEARIEAAARVHQAGYPLAFHFDPLVRYPGWAAEYAGLVRSLFDQVPPGAIRWISLGGFRYTPAMKQRIKSRFPRTRLFLGEFVSCPDGKYRYFSRHRVELYRKMKEEIARYGPGVPVYLCMEAAHVWRKVFGGIPADLPCLEGVFEERAFPCEGRIGPD
ncbi:MAG: DNA photolyase, partial [Planctomycetes bacterium]|nr:DNA photolyase [Planctomycetota bacterium]